MRLESILLGVFIDAEARVEPRDGAPLVILREVGSTSLEEHIPHCGPVSHPHAGKILPHVPRDAHWRILGESHRFGQVNDLAAFLSGQHLVEHDGAFHPP